MIVVNGRIACTWVDFFDAVLGYPRIGEGSLWFWEDNYDASNTDYAANRRPARVCSPS